MAIYLGSTLLTSSGGGGGIVKKHIITSGTSFDFTSLGIADGDTIGLFLVGGGEGGDILGNGGHGGNMWWGTDTLTTAGTATVSIGAGGSAGGGVRGGSTSISGGGLSQTFETGTSNLHDTSSPGTAGSVGYVWGGAGADDNQNHDYGQYGINGYGGGGSYGNQAVSATPPNAGRGGDADGSAQAAGSNGAIIIYYT